VEQTLELSVRVNSTMEEFQDKSDLLKTRKDILWGMYQEHRTHARHNETSEIDCKQHSDCCFGMACELKYI
jgi:hypothetical protein